MSGREIEMIGKLEAGLPAPRAAALSGERRRMLAVAFHYPPDHTSTGVLRTLKFTQYLVGHGWRSDVVSVPESLYVSTDPAFNQQVPQGTRVFRTWAADVKALLGVRGIYPDFAAIPDRYWPWIFSAARRAGRLLREEKVDVVYTTYPVATAHLVGLWLKSRFRGIPWVADFRDPWVEDSMPPFRRWLEGHLERMVVERADRVICNTPAMRRSFLARYPGVAPEKFVTITNGYDEADFAGLRPEPVAKFEILYPGMIATGNRNPRPLLAGIRMAIDRGWLNPDDLQITFLGCGPNGRDPEFQGNLDRFRLREASSLVEDRVPHRQALRRMAGADVLVVLSEPLGEGPAIEAERRWSHLQVPAKVYEYLRLGRPMLALVSGGAVAELLGQTRGGVVVAPGDVEGIARSLGELYRRQAKSSPALPALVEGYTRENLTKRLVEELNSLAKRG